MRWSLCPNPEHIPIRQKRVPPIASHGSFGALHWPYALRCVIFFPRASFAFCLLPLNAPEALSWMFFVYRAVLRYDKICWNLNIFFQTLLKCGGLLPGSLCERLRSAQQCQLQSQRPQVLCPFGIMNTLKKKTHARNSRKVRHGPRPIFWRQSQKNKQNLFKHKTDLPNLNKQLLWCIMLLSLKCHPIIISSWPNSIGIISLGSTMFHSMNSTPWYSMLFDEFPPPPSLHFTFRLVLCH